MKPEAEIASKRERKRLRRRKIRTGAVLIKYFRNIASTDLNALFPNVRVVMSMFDKLVLSVPALAGAVPILLNLASTVTVLFLVIGFYLGMVAAVEHDQMKTAFAAMSGLVALVGFVMRQWLRYQRQSLKYQKELTDNIYFRNVNNNAGIFDYIIGAAEEQECKEAFLAYYLPAHGEDARRRRPSSTRASSSGSRPPSRSRWISRSTTLWPSSSGWACSCATASGCRCRRPRRRSRGSTACGTAISGSARREWPRTLSV